MNNNLRNTLAELKINIERGRQHGSSCRRCDIYLRKSVELIDTLLKSTAPDEWLARW